jgi:hypothetical protein
MFHEVMDRLRRELVETSLMAREDETGGGFSTPGFVLLL